MINWVRMLGLLLTMGVATPALAVERADYDDAKYEAVVASGRPVLIQVWAAWCPVCQAQDPLIERLSADPAYKDLLILSVDFDAQKPAVRRFRAIQQSTLIAVRQGREIARSVGDTSEAGLRALLQKAVGS
jgi:thioredoxin-like negative regulator of GroEL